MKTVKIQIDADFGSKFQEQFARDSLMAQLKAWRIFLNNAHKKNDVDIEIDEVPIQNLEWFNWRKKTWQE